jgi:hypothetical protein
MQQDERWSSACSVALNVGDLHAALLRAAQLTCASARRRPSVGAIRWPVRSSKRCKAKLPRYGYN